MEVGKDSLPLKLPQSPKWRFGKEVSIGQMNLLGAIGMDWWWSWNESDMWEKPSGEWLPEKYPPKKSSATPPISNNIPKEEDILPVSSSPRFTEEELLKRLCITTTETFWSAINKEWYLYKYLIETRKEDWEELFEPIKHDLLSWIYGVGDKTTNSVEQFIKCIAIIRTKIKGDLRNYPIMCSIVEFVSTPDFYKAYINTDKSVIWCFLDIKVRPVYDQQLINELWINFKGIIKRNNSIEDYNLYTSGITLTAQKNISWKELVNWSFIYPWKEELVKNYIDIFDNELIYSFAEYAKWFLGVWADFHKLICLEYAHKSGKWRSEYSLVAAARSKNHPKKVKTSNQVTIHDGNRDADSLLSKWLKDQLSPITDDTMKHCIISWYKWSGKTTIIKHYLNEIQCKFPKTRIWDLTLEILTKEVSAIAQETNPELKSKWFEAFVNRLGSCIED